MGLLLAGITHPRLQKRNLFVTLTTLKSCYIHSHEDEMPTM